VKCEKLFAKPNYLLYLQTIMKNFAFILSVYIMVLTAIPCVDKPENEPLHKSEITQKSSDNHHHSDSDHCSPFCTCNCCACPVIQQELAINFESIPFQLETFSSDLTNLFISRPNEAIWQPPKIG
jgi:hypothetical protein